MKSQGKTIKSRSIRCAKWRRIAHVPKGIPCCSLYVWRSMRNEGNEADASEWIWLAIGIRWTVGQTSSTSRYTYVDINEKTNKSSYAPVIPEGSSHVKT
jgi:hypothetical protein